MSTAAARTAATLPETFDTPPARRRCPTGTSSVRRPAVAPPRLDHDPCAGGSRALDRAILGAAVDDDDLAHALPQHRGHAGPNRLLLVQAGDDGSDITARRR